MNLTAKRKLLLGNFCVLISLIAFCVCFPGPLSSFLNSVIVKPVLSGFNNSGIATGLLLVFLAALASWIWLSSTRMFSTVLASTALVIYMTQRWNDYWNFYPFIWLPGLSVWDVVMLFLVTPILRIFVPAGGRGGSVSAPGGFIEEKVVKNENGDSFQRAEVAGRIAEMILDTQNERSFAIGIVGEYGSGKTSFINLIEEKLGGRVQHMRFNPWSAEKAEHISRDFFDQLAQELYYLDPTISSLVTTYGRKLGRMHSQSEQILKHFPSLSRTNNHPGGDFRRINDLLEKCGKKLVVIIDDVDRLYPEEVMEVLKLIRNTAGFANVVYLVAYDSSFVQAAIQAINSEVASSFLDKIIQLEIPLPKREEDDLLHLLETILKPIITDAHYVSLQKDIIPHGFKLEFDLSFRTVFRNSRDVIRFVNSFQLSYQALKDETLFENLFILELLKFRFISVYDLLYERRNDWLSRKAKPSRHEEYYELVEFEKDGRKYLEIEKSLTSHSPQDLALIRSLLKSLFNDYRRHRNARHSIIYPLFFERYFRFRISKTEISASAFNNNWDAGIGSMQRYIDQLTAGNLTKALTDRLFQVEPKSMEAFEQKIRCLFYIGPKYVEKFGWTSFDDSALINSLWNIENGITDAFYQRKPEQYVKFLNQVLSDARPPFLFENDFLYRARKTNRDIALSRAVMLEHQIRYFEDHVKEFGLTDAAMWILYSIRFYQQESTPDGKVRETWHFEPLVLPIARAIFAAHDPLHLLRYSIYFEVRDKRLVMVDPHILEFFDSAKDLRDFVAGHALLPEHAKKDYLRFFDQWEGAGMKRLVEYVFIPELARIRQDNEEDE